MKADYSDLFDLLGDISRVLPKDWPAELPDESAPGFWEAATRQEFSHRSALSEKIRFILSGDVMSASAWSPIEAWLYRRRAEWAIQLVIEAAKRRKTSDDSPRDFLLRVMVEDWSGNGAIAFWNHAMERDGKPHPYVDKDVLRILS